MTLGGKKLEAKYKHFFWGKKKGEKGMEKS